MNMNFLEFEQPIAELEAKIEELRYVGSDAEINITEEISRLQTKSRELTESIFSKLDAWQVSQLARHPQRPYTLDYIERMFTDFEELHGDRAFADDPAIVGGIARLDGRPVMVIGQQKGRGTTEKLKDTPGAYPGIDAEERGQSEAIARNLFVMAQLKTPIICTVIGEGGSGGALAIGVGDRLLMLEYGTYAVISPEGCSTILWKSAEKASTAAEAMGITSARLKELELVDEIVKEPLGGAHRDPDGMASNLKTALLENLEVLDSIPLDKLLENRYQRLMQYGNFSEN